MDNGSTDDTVKCLYSALSMSRSLFHSGKTLYKSYVCRCKAINNEHMLKKIYISTCKQSYSNEKPTESENSDNQDQEHNLPSGLLGKYKVFRDEDAPVIFDVNEEKQRIELNELLIQEEEADPYGGLNLTRKLASFDVINFQFEIGVILLYIIISLFCIGGVNGVFDIEDLVEVLQRDNARHIFVASVPKEYSYVDYIVVVTGKSPRHMIALATFVRKLFKLKKSKRDHIPKIEGENSKSWMALDLGNVKPLFTFFSR